MKQLFKISILSLISILFIQCQEDRVITTPIGNPNPVMGVTYEVNEPISVDETWTTGNTYVLNDLICVLDNATLTIEPGVVVKGATEKSGLVISQGSKIEANGTLTDPIIFTADEDEIEPGEIVSPNLTSEDVGLWGGIFLLGQAPVSFEFDPNPVVMSLLPMDACELNFGGDDPSDSSGSMSFVSIRHTGAPQAPEEEPSGLVVAGVGSGTTIENVELYATKDDGLKIFGGTVDLTNIVLSHFGDDAIDIDNAWGGTIDNTIGSGANGSDSALELDGGEGTANATFTVRNTSFRGEMVGERYIEFRNNVNCLIENVYFFDFDGGAEVRLRKDDDAQNWLSESINVSNLQFNTSHLIDGNLTIEDIFVDTGDDMSNAFEVRLPDASIVTEPTTGADKSVFGGWTVASLTGILDAF